MVSSISRRQFISNASSISLLGLLTGGSLTRFAFGAVSTPSFEILETKTFDSLDSCYCGWPTVAKRGNELLVVASSGREGHVCPFGRVDFWRSKDGGNTWTWPQTIYDGPIDDRDAGICVTNKGTILVTTFTSLYYATEFEQERQRRLASPEHKGTWSDQRFNHWSAAHNRISKEERENELGCWMLRSTDGGVTWSERYSTPFNSPHGPIQLASGRLLYTGKELWTKEKRCGACVSDDDGVTWQVKGFVPVREGDSEEFYDELHTVEASDGTLITFIRNENPNNYSEELQTISKDGGETWSVPKTIGIWGVPAFLMKLQDGRLLATYGHRRAPFGIQARISEDNGASWSEPIVLYGEGTTIDLGYPSTVQLDDGSLFTVWYEVLQGNPSSRLRSCHWRIN